MISGEPQRVAKILLAGLTIHCLSRGDLHDHLTIEPSAADALQERTTGL
mgnify:CR=1 FL=1